MSSAGRSITAAVRWTHDAAMRATRELDGAELYSAYGPTAPPVSFHLWHMARWADRLAAHLGGPGDAEVWVTAAWAERFGFADRELGYGATGMGLGDDGWEALPVPDRETLFDYVGAAFGAANQVMKTAGDRTDETCVDLYGQPGNVAGVLVAHLGHMSRHLGMIEALVGVSGRPGTASV